ncbi:MAG: hypothetical protein HZA53_12835 [Planctomycetes bacterium]|nr:hypothetical protein [Planctomycetota bacterium]
MRVAKPSTALLVLAFLACAGPRRSANPVRAAEPRSAVPEASTPAWEGAHALDSALGTYRVFWRASLDPVVEGETFSVDAWVFDARSPERPLTDVAVDVDAGMPQHGHGMAAFARVSRRADGGWHAEGLRFHMIGRWELAFDVARGARTERAQAGIELE